MLFKLPLLVHIAVSSPKEHECEYVTPPMIDVLTPSPKERDLAVVTETMKTA
jgi:hypothetical protein